MSHVQYLLSLLNGQLATLSSIRTTVYQVTTAQRRKERRACVYTLFHTAHFLAGMNGTAPKSPGVRVDLVFAESLPGIGGGIRWQ